MGTAEIETKRWEGLGGAGKCPLWWVGVAGREVGGTSLATEKSSRYNSPNKDNVLGLDVFTIERSYSLYSGLLNVDTLKSGHLV